MKCYLVADVHTTNQGRKGACSSIKISFFGTSEMLFQGILKDILHYYRCLPLITTLNGQIPSAIFFFFSFGLQETFFQTSWLACMNFVSYFPNPPPPPPTPISFLMIRPLWCFICNVECYIYEVNYWGS